MKFTNVEEGYIVGLVTRGEGRRLARLAGRVRHGECIVEIGSQGGSSTSWLAMGVHKAGNHAPVFAVDLWDSPQGDRREMHAEPAVFRRFQAQIDYCASAGFLTAEDVQSIRGASLDVAARWDYPIGLLHIDALHTYEACSADIKAWTPHVALGGVVVIHDYFDKRFGVRRASDELAVSAGWEVVGRYKSEWNRARRGQIILRRQ